LPSGESGKKHRSIVNDLARQFKTELRPGRLRRWALSRPQWQLLLHLHRHEGMTQTRSPAAARAQRADGRQSRAPPGRARLDRDPGRSAHRLNKYLYLLPPARPPLRQVHQLARKVDLQSLRGMRAQDVAQLSSCSRAGSAILAPCADNARQARPARRAAEGPQQAGRAQQVRRSSKRGN